MTTLHARETARMCAEIVELCELRMLARCRSPGLAEFLRAFLLHWLVDGDCVWSMTPVQNRPSTVITLPARHFRFAYFRNAQDARTRAPLGRFRFTREELR